MDEFNNILELIAQKGPNPSINIYHFCSLEKEKGWVVKVTVNCGDCFREEDFDKSWNSHIEGGFEMQTEAKTLDKAIKEISTRLAIANQNMISLEEVHEKMNHN